ncbi:unnamed protein product [Adineta steineri]|uniref:BED-type domain-containing protein n=1 Tax=Adineta steineri TaxID=433720 RepID=A0A819RXB3_9BILA|nr:unnamed protein product [Adineta steineri]
MSTDASSSSSSSPSSLSSHSNSHTFILEKTKHLLLIGKHKYQVIKNEAETKALWWRAYSYSAHLNDNNELKRIPGFVSCFKCMNTYLYNRLSGSKRFKQHADKCFSLVKDTTSSSITFSSSKQTTLNNMGFTKGVKITESDVTKIKDLSVKCICSDIRRFSILDDSDFRNLAKEFIRLGAVYGTFDINNASRGEKNISRHIMIFAGNLRRQALQKYLEFSRIDSLPNVNIGFDCGNNFIDFFQNEKKKIKVTAGCATDKSNTEQTTIAASIKNGNHESSDDKSESSSDDECDHATALSIIK